MPFPFVCPDTPNHRPLIAAFLHVVGVSNQVAWLQLVHRDPLLKKPSLFGPHFGRVDW